MRRVPIFATLLVLIAAGTMVALGQWQWQRKAWKEALIARYQANAALPPIAFEPGRTGADALFRRATAPCPRVTGWRREGAGAAGFRHIALCAAAAPGARGFAVSLGTAPDPRLRPRWTGGTVRGWITTERTTQSWIAQILNPMPPALMLVSATPAPGLKPGAPPDPAGIPNNHLAYAVQWYLFAALAIIIYALALRERWRRGANRG